jgi:hypothetical protein
MERPKCPSDLNPQGWEEVDPNQWWSLSLEKKNEIAKRMRQINSEKDFAALDSEGQHWYYCWRYNKEYMKLANQKHQLKLKKKEAAEAAEAAVTAKGEETEEEEEPQPEPAPKKAKKTATTKVVVMQDDDSDDSDSERSERSERKAQDSDAEGDAEGDAEMQQPQQPQVPQEWHDVIREVIQVERTCMRQQNSALMQRITALEKQNASFMARITALEKQNTEFAKPVQAKAQNKRTLPLSATK